jgi:mannose-1-phosphate guanylyltransferase
VTSLHAAVLAGGSGTRFWPASTRDVPKQMLPLTGAEPLLVETVARLKGLIPIERVLVVTGARYADQVRALLPELPAENVLAEPRPRNTAAACGLAAHRVLQDDPDAVLVTLPSDHVISPDAELRRVLAAAGSRADAARSLVTLGLTPRYAATGYGWIETGDEVAQVDRCAVRAVARFTEKPDRPTAQSFLSGGRHLWNLGMFAWRADVLLEELARHQPGVAGPLAAAAPSLGTPQEVAALDAAFDACTSISIDHGVLEHSERVECVPCGFGWDDLGAFPALLRHLPRDAGGNVAVGSLLAIDATGCVTWTDGGGLTALLGVDDLIVVRAHGVTLVAPLDRAEDVKQLVAELEARGLEDFR